MYPAVRLRTQEYLASLQSQICLFQNGWNLFARPLSLQRDDRQLVTGSPNKPVTSYCQYVITGLSLIVLPQFIDVFFDIFTLESICFTHDFCRQVASVDC